MTESTTLDSDGNAAQVVIQKVVNRLEETPVEFVEGFIDLLAAPERKRETFLLRDLLVLAWLLLEQPDAFAESFKLSGQDILESTGAKSRYDQLIGIICGLIEALIARHLPPIALTTQSPSSKPLQFLWGGLTLHIKLALPLESINGSKLLNNGVVMLPNGASFPCEPPLSERQIFDLITGLGRPFMSYYAMNYVRHERLRLLIVSQTSDQTNRHTSTKKPRPAIELVVQERTLNRYVDKFAKNMAALFHEGCTRLAQEKSENPLAILCKTVPFDVTVDKMVWEAASVLSVPQPTSSALAPARRPRNGEHPSQPDNSLIGTAIYVPTHHSEPDHLSSTPMKSRAIVTPPIEELLENIMRVQGNRIRDSAGTSYIPQHLVQTDQHGGNPKPIILDELKDWSKARLVIIGPPGVGKTRLQQEILLTAGDSQIYRLWVDLTPFSTGAIGSFYRFAASQFLDQIQARLAILPQLEADLHALDLAGKIHWHLDERTEESPSSLLPDILALPQFMLSTTRASKIRSTLKAHRWILDGFVNVQPFTQEHIMDFIKSNLSPSSQQARTTRRARQLPGLARLPAGLAFLLERPEQELVVDLLIGYVNSNLERCTEPLIDPNDLIFDGLKDIHWRSEALDCAYILGRAAYMRGQGTAKNGYQSPRVKVPVESFSQIGIDEIVPYMGASQREQNIQLATQHVEKAVRGRLLQVHEDGRSFGFVAPEVGRLLAAIVELAPHHGRRWLDYALWAFQDAPNDSVRQMMLALGAWHQEKGILRHTANMEVYGTAVPTELGKPFAALDKLRAP